MFHFLVIGTGLALLIGAIISAVTASAGAVYSNYANKKNQKKAFQQQQQLMQEEAAINQAQQDRTYRLYNSPSAQRKAMEIAGLNPFAQASSIQPMMAKSPEVSGASVPSFAPTNNPMAGFQTFADQLPRMAQENELIQAQTAEANARANNELLQGELLQNAVDMKEYANIVQREAALGEKLKNRFRELSNDLLEIEKNYAPEERAAKINELWASYELKLESAAKTREEKEIVRKMAKYTERKEEAEIHAREANAALAEQQAKESKSKAANLDADTETQNKVRDSVVQEREAKAALSKADEALIESDKEAREMENALTTWLAGQVIERKPTQSYWDMALEVANLYLEYRGQNIDLKKSENAQNSKDNSLLLGMILRYAIAKGL